MNRVLIVFGLVCVLSGCKSSHLSEIMSGDRSEPRVVDVSAQEEMQAGALIPVGHQPMAPLRTLSDPDLMHLYTQVSGQQGGYIGAPADGGIIAPQDSSVTLFPVDGQTPWGGGQTYLPVGGAYQHGYGSGGSRVYFNHGSAALDAKDRSVLDQVAQDAKFAPVSRITVEGHASSRAETSDPIRGRILNLKESMNRSFAVSKNLIQQGVPPEKIKTVSWGDSNVSPGTSESEARRVDIYAGTR